MTSSGPRSAGRLALMVTLMGALLLCVGSAAPIWAAAPAPEADEESLRQHDAEGEDVAGEDAAGEDREAPSKGWSALTTGGSYRVEIEADPFPIPLNEMFSMHFRIIDGQTDDQPVSGAVVTASARMPEHQHGTNLQPRITSHGDGTATGVGFLWHMEGKWELRVGVASGGSMEWAVFPFKLEP